MRKEKGQGNAGYSRDKRDYIMKLTTMVGSYTRSHVWREYREQIAEGPCANLRVLPPNFPGMSDWPNPVFPELNHR